MATLTIYTDGLCEPNPAGYACWAWIAYGPHGTKLNESFGCSGHGAGQTNNVAEYESILQALRHAVTRAELLRDRGLLLEVRSDSRLIINQITGAYTTSAPALIPLKQEAQQLVDTITLFHPITLLWVPREQNEAADALSRKAYAAARQDRRYATR